MSVDPDARARLDAFGGLLRRWNRVYNLVGRRDIDEERADAGTLFGWERLNSAQVVPRGRCAG